MKHMTIGVLGLCLCANSLAAPAVVQLLQAPAWRVHDGHRTALAVSQELASGDRVVTGVGARARLRLAEGSMVKLGENAELALKDMVVPATDDGVFTGFLDVVKGAFRFTTTLVGRHRELTAQLHSATIGIRGTDVWGKTEETRDFVVLLEGKVAIERDGQSYALDVANSLFMAPRGLPPQPIGPVNPEDLGRWAQETEAQPAAGIVNGDGSYRVYLASSTSAAAAAALVAQLAEAGYAATVEPATVATRSWFRVTLGGYASRADASAVATRLQAAFHLASPWIAGGS